MPAEVADLRKGLTSATQMKTTDEPLRKENEILKQHIEANTTLISCLQQGIASSTKLYQMLESSYQKQAEDSAKNLAEAEKMKSEFSKENSTLKKELIELKHFISASKKCSSEQIEDLKKRLVEAENMNTATTEKNEKLEQELHDLKNYATSVATPLQQNIQKLTNDLSAAERLTIDLSKQKSQLEHDLSESKQHAASAEASLQQEIHQLSNSSSEAKSFATEVSEENAKMAQELGKVKLHAASVEASLLEKIHQLSYSSSEAKKHAAEMSVKNGKMAQELSEVKQHAANIQSLYDDQMHELNNNKGECVGMSEKIKRMEEQIIELQLSVSTKDVQALKAEENLNMLKKLAAKKGEEVQNRIAVVEKNLADTHKENIGLKTELERWKRDLPPVSTIFKSYVGPGLISSELTFRKFLNFLIHFLVFPHIEVLAITNDFSRCFCCPCVSRITRYSIRFKEI